MGVTFVLCRETDVQALQQRCRQLLRQRDADRLARRQDLHRQERLQAQIESLGVYFAADCLLIVCSVCCPASSMQQHRVCRALSKVLPYHDLHYVMVAWMAARLALSDGISCSCSMIRCHLVLLQCNNTVKTQNTAHAR